MGFLDKISAAKDKATQAISDAKIGEKLEKAKSSVEQKIEDEEKAKAAYLEAEKNAEFVMHVESAAIPGAMIDAHKISVDKYGKHSVKNGESVDVPMPKGQHTVCVSYAAASKVYMIYDFESDTTLHIGRNKESDTLCISLDDENGNPVPPEKAEIRSNKFTQITQKLTEK